MDPVKYKFHLLRSGNGMYTRKEYNATLGIHRQVDNVVWSLDAIEEWAIRNDYKVGRDFTINGEEYFHQTY